MDPGIYLITYKNGAPQNAPLFVAFYRGEAPQTTCYQTLIKVDDTFLPSATSPEGIVGKSIEEVTTNDFSGPVAQLVRSLTKIAELEEITNT